MPLDRLMLETDAPYLSRPLPRKTERLPLPLVAETIAASRGITPEEVARITLENGKRFLALPKTRKRLDDVEPLFYSTVTDLARFLGLSISHPRNSAT